MQVTIAQQILYLHPPYVQLERTAAVALQYAAPVLRDIHALQAAYKKHLALHVPMVNTLPPDVALIMGALIIGTLMFANLAVLDTIVTGRLRTAVAWASTAFIALME